MFRGRFEHNLDDKGRLALPSKFREVLSNAEETTLVVTNFDQCLSAYPLREWCKLEQSFCQLPQFDPKVLAFQRYFVSSAIECDMDKAGRINVPSTLRQFAGLDKECIVLGNLNKFEIWSKERWTSMFDNLSNRFSDMVMDLSNLGLKI